jgi:hypothetical protein
MKAVSKTENTALSRKRCSKVFIFHAYQAVADLEISSTTWAVVSGSFTRVAMSAWAMIPKSDGCHLLQEYALPDAFP